MKVSRFPGRQSTTERQRPTRHRLSNQVAGCASVMILNDVFSEFGGEAYRSGRAVRLTLYLPDADAAWAKALAAGCKVASPIRDQFWGDRYGEVEDPPPVSRESVQESLRAKAG